MKREKGRTLGTAYGERGHQAARAKRSTGNTNKAFGSGMMVAGGAVAAAGDLAGGAALVAAGYVQRRLGGVQTDRASKQAAHATAVEGLVAKGRGGSAALGQKGVVPKAASGKRADAGAAFKTADSHFHDTHMTGNQGASAASDQPRKGWSNAARIGAAKARGAKLPYGGDGTA